MRRALKKTNSPPAVVGTSDLKLHLRVDGTDEDGAIASIGRAAQNWCENFTGRSFAFTTWQMALDAFPACGTIDLPRGPLRAVDSVTYVTPGGTTGTLGTADYHVDLMSEPGRLVLARTSVWPDIDERPNAVLVNYTAGYGTGTGTATPDGVPDEVGQAIKLCGSYLFEHRGDDDDMVPAETDMPRAARALLWPLRIFG